MTEHVAERTPVDEETDALATTELAPQDVPAATANIAPDVVVEVVCPSCGTPARVNTTRREADDFCVQCEYPLFWAVERPAPSLSALGGDTGLRRLPGTAGRAVLAFLNCPVCTEPNPPSAVHCARCGSELRPAAVVAAPEPEPEPVVEEVVEVQGRNWWLIGLAAAVVLALLVLIAVLGIDAS